MAGGGGSLGVERTKRGGASKRKKKKRVGFVLDMTPLVDITFLLLTFFMFTTTMAAPQVMEMQIPPEQTEVKVKEGSLLQFFVRGDNKVFYRMGQDDPQAVSLKDIKSVSVKQNINLGNECIVALYVSKDAAYGLVVRILDELNLAEGVITQEIEKREDPKNPGQKMKRERRFTMAELSPDFLKLIEGL